jgi:transposase
MNSLPVFVGLDYHQESVQVCVLDKDGRQLGNRAHPNNWQTIAREVHKHSRVVRAAIEACCGAANLAEELVSKAGWSVDLAHPGFVSRMKQNPDKTDYSDGRLLADLERVGYLPRVWLAPHEVRELRRLVRYRQQLVGERRNVKLRVGALLREERIQRPACRTWSVAWLKWLEREAKLSEQSRWIVDRHLSRLRELCVHIREVEDRLRGLTAQDRLVEELVSMKGIGLVTAVTIRAEIGRFDRFRTGKQLAHFCGLSPRNASSGPRQADAGLIRTGNPEFRAVLIETAHRLMRFQERWRKLGLALRARGKSGSLVAAAIANRWMRWLYHQMQPQPLSA